MGTLLLIDITLSHNHHVIHWFRVKTAKYFLKYYHIYVAININVVCKNDTKDEINILGIQYNYNNTMSNKNCSYFSSAKFMSQTYVNVTYTIKQNIPQVIFHFQFSASMI